MIVDVFLLRRQCTEYLANPPCIVYSRCVYTSNLQRVGASIRRSMIHILYDPAAPQGYWIHVFKVGDPVKHELYTLRIFLLESDTAEMLSNIHQHPIVFCHMKDE